MKIINIQAKVIKPQINIEDYQRKSFAAPSHRSATKWEQECLDAANMFFDRLFGIPGFKEYFCENGCMVKKTDALEFLRSRGHDIAFPSSREYREAFGMWWSRENRPGYIIDSNGWLYDKLAKPEVLVDIAGKKYHPFTDLQSCFPCCENNDAFAWSLCEASAYNVPYLYAITGACGHNIEWLYEGGFTADSDDGLIAVLRYLDEELLPTYNVIVSEDSVAASAGSHAMHIIDTDCGSMREFVRKNKKLLKRVISEAVGQA